MKKVLILAATVAAALSVGVATSAATPTTSFSPPIPHPPPDAGRLLRSLEHAPCLARRGRERP
jgi:hypothetical protein